VTAIIVIIPSVPGIAVTQNSHLFTKHDWTDGTSKMTILYQDTHDDMPTRYDLEISYINATRL